MIKATGTLVHSHWDEKPYHDSGTQKGTIARIDAVFDGDVTGEAKTVYTMAYTEGGNSAHYAGHLLFDGKIGGRAGTFIIFEQGHWGNGTANSTWQIVADSGTGDLAGISGTGGYVSKDKSVNYELNYDFK